MTVLVVSPRSRGALYFDSEVQTALDRFRKNNHPVVPVLVELESDDPRVPYGLNVFYCLGWEERGCEGVAEAIADQVLAGQAPRP